MVSYYNSISGQKNFHYPPIWDKFILISDKWNSKSTCPIGQVEFTRRNFSLSSQLPKDFYTNLFSTNFCFFLIKKLASFWHSFIEDMVPTFYIIWKANNGDNVISFMATSGKNSKGLNCITSTIFKFFGQAYSTFEQPNSEWHLSNGQVEGRKVFFCPEHCIFCLCDTLCLRDL